MNSALGKCSRLAASMALLALTLPHPANAFPPAPNHLIFGIVRDQIGNPLAMDNAEIVLEASSGATIHADVVPQLEPGLNYRIEVPMDAGLTDDLYQPTALLPAAPFKLRVRIGQTMYLPMEMTADYSRLGQPGGRTRIDLTLGVDADGNGLPDAWEKAVAAQLGRQWLAGQFRPGDFYPGTGMTYRDVYLAGTYAVAPKEGFTLRILSGPGEAPRLAFTAVKGRSYTLQASADLGEWTTVPFRVLPSDSAAAPVNGYQATETKRVEIETPTLGDEPVRFFRLMAE
jgi:hypothetical protein